MNIFGSEQLKAEVRRMFVRVPKAFTETKLAQLRVHFRFSNQVKLFNYIFNGTFLFAFQVEP